MTADQYVLDTETVHRFIDGVRAVVGSAGSAEQAVERIRPAFAELLADSKWLPDAYQQPAPERGMGGGIGQWLLYRSADGSLSLFSLVIPPAAQTPVHDHLAWGLVARDLGLDPPAHQRHRLRRRHAYDPTPAPSSRSAPATSTSTAVSERCGYSSRRCRATTPPCSIWSATPHWCGCSGSPQG